MHERLKRLEEGVAGELIVPALMLLCVGAYWYDAAGLSVSALAFPMALTLVIASAMALIVLRAFIASDRSGGASNKGSRPKGGIAISYAKIWGMVLLPVPLLYFWKYLGAITVLIFYMFFIMIVLGERKRRWLVCLPAVSAIALVYLFKSILYVRLPGLPWPFGG